jgi:hypothetical protein
MVLSHSRKEVLVWGRRMDQVSWQHPHNEAFRRLGGIPALLRIDNRKTGGARGAGPWGEVNDAYRGYAQAVGFHVDAGLPRCPEHKGKVENQVRFLRRRLQLTGTRAGRAQLQNPTDEQLARSDRQRVCPATGLRVEASWQAEQRRLRPLPLLPGPFDLTMTRTVQRDCTVHFAGRTYSVPLVLGGRAVAGRGGVGVVQIWHDGRVGAEHPRHTSQRLLREPAHYDGPGDERVAPPVPLGKMGRQLPELREQPVAQRPLELSAALAEVAR